MVHNHKIKIISSGTQLQLLNKVLDQSKVLLEMYLPILDIFFSSNCNIHKSSYGLCFWASDPLIDRFYLDLSIKGSEAQKQR